MDGFDGIRCTQERCQRMAAYSYVWTELHFACEEHMEKVLAVASAIGFPVPANTMVRLHIPPGDADTD